MAMTYTDRLEMEVLFAAMMTDGTSGNGSDAHDPIDPWSPPSDGDQPDAHDPIDPWSPEESPSN